MITDTILYIALIVVALLLLHSIKDNISTEWLEKTIWKWVLSPKKIMRWCKKKGFESYIDEDGIVLLSPEDKLHYYLYCKYPCVIFSKGGKINDDLDREVLLAAIKDYNNTTRPIKIVMGNDAVEFILYSCNPIPWNFYKSFDWYLSVFEIVEQELESSYQEIIDRSENPA